jgi:hypothetical protein
MKDNSSVEIPFLQSLLEILRKCFMFEEKVTILSGRRVFLQSLLGQIK